jgi:Tfp pilus assembly protein PilN
MINLLPPQEKQNLETERQRKMTMILGIVALVFFISLILVLVSVNFSAASQLRSQSVLLENKRKESQKAEFQEIKREINLANQNLSKIGAFYKNRVMMTGFLEKIASLLPEGIYLKSISLSPVGTDHRLFSVSIFGHASSRERAIELNKRLKDASFNYISFPSGTWTEKEDFDFTATFQATI